MLPRLHRYVSSAVAVVAAIGGLAHGTAAHAATPPPAQSAPAGGTASDAVAAPDGTAVTAATPFRAMWLWDNPVRRVDDARGRDYADAEPATILQFAREQGLDTVHVAAPWASDEGPIKAWLDATVTTLHDAGLSVSVLGGDHTWLHDPSLGATWARTATTGRPVDRVQLSLEPWTQPAWQVDEAQAVADWVAAIDAVRAALPAGVELGMDAPYWLAWQPAPGGGTLLDVVLDRADSVAIVAFRDHAEGEGGILPVSADARRAAAAAGVPYTIGVETDTPEVAGGPEITFADDGVEALERESWVVAYALGGDAWFRGIVVERYHTWRDLVLAGPTRTDV